MVSTTSSDTAVDGSGLTITEGDEVGEDEVGAGEGEEEEEEVVVVVKGLSGEEEEEGGEGSAQN